MSCPIITEEHLVAAVSNNKFFQGIIFFFCVVCFVGSVVVLLSLYRSRQLTPHLLLVASLSFADLILCIESGIFSIYLNRQPDLMKSCQTDAFFSTFGVMSSVISFGMITIERFLVICYSVENHTSKTIFSIAVAYTYVILVSAITTSSPEHVDLAGGMLCRPLFCSQTTAMIVVNGSIVIVVSVFLVSVVYCPYKIMQIYNKASSAVADSIHAAENLKANMDRKKNERKIFIKLSIITGVFVVMVTPLSIALAYEIITKSLSPDGLVYVYMLGLGSNSAVNPFLLYVFDISVKNRVNQFLGIQSKPRPTASPKPIRKLPERSHNLKETVYSDAKDTVKLSP